MIIDGMARPVQRRQRVRTGVDVDGTLPLPCYAPMAVSRIAPAGGPVLKWVLPRRARPRWRLPQHAPV